MFSRLSIWLAVSFVPCWIFAAQDDGPHDWVSDTGSTVRATLVRSETITVYVLRKEDGTEVKVPENRLSANSRTLAEMVLGAQEQARAAMNDKAVGLPQDETKQVAAEQSKPIPKTAQPPKLGFDPKTVVSEYLRQNVNDASKLEIVSLGEPIDLAKCVLWTGNDATEDFRFMDTKLWAPADRPGVAVLAKYRATNAFGALRLEEKMFSIDADGEVFGHVPANDVRTSRPTVKNDVFLDEFFQTGEDARRLAGGSPVPAKKSRPAQPVPSTSTSTEPFRYWTIKGVRTLAQLLEYREGNVVLRSKTGQTIRADMDDLSVYDCTYLERKAVNEIP